MHTTDFGAGHWPVDRNRDGGGHRRRRDALQGCPPFRQMVRTDTQGVFLGQHSQCLAVSRNRDIAIEDAAHPWRPRRLARRGTGPQREPTPGRPGLPCAAEHHDNNAACALANKRARICYAVLRDHAAYGNPSPRPNKKPERTAFAIAA